MALILWSRYLPAKPGALRCEPLKAAYPGGFGAVSHPLRAMLHQVAKLTRLITCICGCTPICRGVIFASSSIDGLIFVCLAAHGFRVASHVTPHHAEYGRSGAEREFLRSVRCL
jgi:hypothetical protein